jgi:hypothetical protein
MSPQIPIPRALLPPLLLPLLTSAFEFYVGVTDLTPTSNVVVWANSSWMDGLSVGFPPTYSVADLVRLSGPGGGGGLRLLPCVHANIETMQRQLTDHSAPSTLSPYTFAYTTVLFDFANATAGLPRPMWWWSFIEDDSSGVGFPYTQLSVPPSDVTAAWTQWDDYLVRSLAMADAVVPAAASSPRVAQVGFGETSHSYASRGVDLLLVERANDDIGDLSTSVAFARGASRQYGVAWGIDLSWWWGVVYSGVNAMPALYHRRHAILTYASGAAAINIEGGDGLVDSTGLHPTLLGQEMQRFGEFVKAHQADRERRREERRREEKKTPRPTVPGPAPDSGPLLTTAPARMPGAMRRRPRRPSVAQLGPTIGEAITPAVVLLPCDHGYQTRPYWSTQMSSSSYTRLPPRQGDAGIAGFFAHAFPGATFAQDAFPFGSYASNDPPASPFAESAITAQYAPTPSSVFSAAPSVPFGTFQDRNAAASFFQGGAVDPSPWRPMSDARYGEVFDVAVVGVGLSTMSPTAGVQPNNVYQAPRRRAAKEEAGAGAGAGAGAAAGHHRTTRPGAESSSYAGLLDGYALAVLLGPINLTSTLKADLLAFAEAGGTVLVASGVVGPGDADLVGATLLPQLRAGRSWTWLADGSTVNEPFRYTPLSPGGGGGGENLTVLATASGGSSQPLVLRHAVGAGSVVTCLVPWFVGGDASGLARLSQRLLDDLLAAVQPVLLSNASWPVDYVSSEDAEGSGRFVVAIANNEDGPWEGTVTLNPAVYGAEGEGEGEGEEGAGGGGVRWADCVELLSGAQVPVGTNGTSFTVAVGAFDVAAVECDVVGGKVFWG